MSRDLLSVQEVARILHLHVRTVRAYVREGRLKAVRIGKQYRIERADVETLMGRPVPPEIEEIRRTRYVEGSTIVQIDVVTPDEANYITNMLMSAAKGPREDAATLKVETIYDPERARLKIIVLAGSLKTQSSYLDLINVLLNLPP
ncbi:MAG TPA: helix-turn-helix domain-containing protein [Steroidobacteraceae bacterium]|jgi:excisionase family DNA binding protein